MRKALMIGILGAAVVLAPSVAGARASIGSSKGVTFSARVPCGVLCAYQVADGVAPSKIQTCAHPFPAGSYSDVVVTAPRGATGLLFEGRPTGDWDYFVCDGARNLSGSSASVGSVGATEVAFVPVRPGHRYTIRGYNFSDVFPSVGSVRFIQRAR